MWHRLQNTNLERIAGSTVLFPPVVDPGFLKRGEGGEGRGEGEGGRGADLIERYRNNPRQNRLRDSLVPFLNSKLKRAQRGR